MNKRMSGQMDGQTNEQMTLSLIMSVSGKIYENVIPRNQSQVEGHACDCMIIFIC